MSGLRISYLPSSFHQVGTKVFSNHPVCSISFFVVPHLSLGGLLSFNNFICGFGFGYFPIFFIFCKILQGLYSKCFHSVTSRNPRATLASVHSIISSNSCEFWMHSMLVNHWNICYLIDAVIAYKENYSTSSKISAGSYKFNYCYLILGK